jgi:uncharacterized protein YunC (DUF1805 family)
MSGINQLDELETSIEGGTLYLQLVGKRGITHIKMDGFKTARDKSESVIREIVNHATNNGMKAHSVKWEFVKHSQVN